MKPLTPAPLLLVIASFDPNGNGKNDYDPAHPELLYAGQLSDCNDKRK